ncbi:MAG: GntR family transcriptional regulator [Candidatus Marinimicrobia bacterium]|nr:GntR family transcriptional regulator [Candidatus Neomarinimicrobiota bacterium]
MKDKPRTQPKYAQLEALLRRQIAGLKVGAPLPSVREIMARHKVSMATAVRAFSNLRQAGLVTAQHGSGMYVAARRAGRRRDGTLVGIVPPFIDNAFFVPLLKALDLEFHERHLNPVVHASLNSTERMERILERFRKLGVAAVAYFPITGQDQARFLEANRHQLQMLESARIPAVIMDSDLPYTQAPVVRCDDLRGGAQAAEYLAERGHRSVAFLESAFTPFAEMRWQGFSAVADARGLRVRRISQAGLGHDPAAAQAAVTRLQRARPAITAVFAVCDLWAFNLMRALNAAGVAVPQRLSVLGFDDVDFARMCQPPLTTFAQPLAALARAAAEALQRQLRRPQQPVASTILPARLVERNSVALHSPAL